MILPNKYITLSQSLIGISSIVLTALGDKKITIEKLWDKVCKNYDKKELKKLSYQKFLLTLDFMFITNMINCSDGGEIYNENREVKN